MKRRLFALGLAAALCLSLLSGCGAKPSTPSDTGSSGNDSAGGKVYYLNFKPEQDAQWQELADLYTKETGVEVTVVTAASGNYETTLKSEMAKTDAPTLFQVNGPVGLAAWKDYCYDLTGSDIASQLTSKEFALMDGDKMAGIGYVRHHLQQGSAGAGRLLRRRHQELCRSEEGGRGHHRPQGRAGLLRLHLRRHGWLLRLALQDPPGQPAHLL